MCVCVGVGRSGMNSEVLKLSCGGNKPRWWRCHSFETTENKPHVSAPYAALEVSLMLEEIHFHPDWLFYLAVKCLFSRAVLLACSSQSAKWAGWGDHISEAFQSPLFLVFLSSVSVLRRWKYSNNKISPVLKLRNTKVPVKESKWNQRAPTKLLPHGSKISYFKVQSSSNAFETAI